MVYGNSSTYTTRAKPKFSGSIEETSATAPSYAMTAYDSRPSLGWSTICLHRELDLSNLEVCQLELAFRNLFAILAK